jgi:hypothetical protein
MSKKYFVVTRYRCGIDNDFVRAFLKENPKTKKFETIEKAEHYMSHHADTDDSDYGVFSIGAKGNIVRHI